MRATSPAGRILKKAIQIIAQRNEPKHFQILFNGLLAKKSIAGFNIQNFDKNIEKEVEIELILLRGSPKKRTPIFWVFMAVIKKNSGGKRVGAGRPKNLVKRKEYTDVFKKG